MTQVPATLSKEAKKHYFILCYFLCYSQSLPIKDEMQIQMKETSR